MSLLNYANEKLCLGIYTLVTHPGRIKERLIDAFHPALAQVPDGDMPQQAKDLWREVWKKVTALEGTKKSGSIEPSINAMSEDEASQIAEDIFEIQARVEAEIRFPY